MRRHSILPFAVALAWALLEPRLAGACSVPFGKVATDKDLAKSSDAIIRARAEAYVEPPCPPSEKCVDHLGKIRFQVLEVLKGPYPSPLFHAWGRLDDHEVINEVGSCYTTAYKPDTEFLLFLEATAGIWVVLPAPMAATNSEVKGADDPRVVGVRAEVKRMKQQTRPRKVAK